MFGVLTAGFSGEKISDVSSTLLLKCDNNRFQISLNFLN